MKILELKNTIIEIANSLEWFNIFEQAGESVSLMIDQLRLTNLRNRKSGSLKKKKMN